MANDDSKAALSRRRFIQATGATGVAVGLAGCGGQQAAQQQQTTGSQATEQAENVTVQQGGKPMDDTLSLAQWAVPSDSQYNPYNGKNYAEPRRALFDRFMRYNIQEDEFYGYAVSDWSMEGQAVSMTVREGQTWHNGDAATAADYVTQLKLDMYTGATLGDFVDDVASAVTAPDDRTARIQFSNPVNEEIVLSLLQPTRLVAKESVYGKHVKAIETAGSEQAKSDALAELQERTIAQPIGSGPFQWEDADSQRTLVTKFDGHPDTGKINFPQAEFKYLPENQARWNALINDQTDGSATLFMPQNQVRRLPDHVRMGMIPRHWGLGLVYNFENEHMGERAVRQAIAHVIDREAVAKNSGAGTGSKVPVNIPSGLTGAFDGSVADEWLKGVAGKFNKYDTDPDAAAKLLREAGYSKSGGTWQDESGNALSAPLKAPAGFTDWVSGAETMVSNLKQFGIDSQLLTRDTSTYWGQDYVNGDFVLALQGWASYDHSYPYFHFDFLYGSTDSQEYWGVPREVEVPSISKPAGELQKRKPMDAVNQLARASEDESMGLIQQLAFTTNQFLPMLPVQEKLAQSFTTDDHWNVPPADSPKMMQYWPTDWLPRQGYWTAKRG